MRELITQFLRALDVACGLVTILIAVAGFALPWELGEDRRDRARLDMSNLCGGIELYRKKHQAELVDLRALVDTGTLEKLPRDPWNNDYLLETSSRGPAIWTYGSDGAPGGSGSSEDLRLECVSGLGLRSGRE